jgi:hypothetical protein
METRRWDRATRRPLWVIVAALACGCSDEPRRFTGDATTPVTDAPTALDAQTADADVGEVDAGLDGGRDGGRDAALDAALDAGDARRDVFVESAVLGCRSNSDCPSPDLYCNGPGCDAPGFCTPRPGTATCPMRDASADDLVCGCDGMTYGSLCQLQAEGVRLQRFGLCPRD